MRRWRSSTTTAGRTRRASSRRMDDAHHSFALKFMSAEEAEAGCCPGGWSGIITIPKDFSADVEQGLTVPIDVRIDNVNVDLTHDVQRALPAAIVAFGRQHKFPGVRVRMVEHDVHAPRHRLHPLPGRQRARARRDGHCRHPRRHGHRARMGAQDREAAAPGAGVRGRRARGQARRGGSRGVRGARRSPCS